LSFVVIAAGAAGALRSSAAQELDGNRNPVCPYFHSNCLWTLVLVTLIHSILGELRRRDFMSDFTDAVEGFDLSREVARDWNASGAKPRVSSVAGIVNKKLRRVRPLTSHELPFLKAHSPGDIKMPLPSATSFPQSPSGKVSPTRTTGTISSCSGTSSRS
jgi:hypothetical protein